MKDRNVQYPNRYQLNKVTGTDDIYDLVPAPGEVSDEGTILNKSNLLSDVVAESLGFAPNDNPKVSDALNMAKANVGDIRYTARNDLSDDWLLCNGQEFSQDVYPKLASIIESQPLRNLSKIPESQSTVQTVGHYNNTTMNFSLGVYDSNMKLSEDGIYYFVVNSNRSSGSYTYNIQGIIYGSSLDNMSFFDLYGSGVGGRPIVRFNGSWYAIPIGSSPLILYRYNGSSWVQIANVVTGNWSYYNSSWQIMDGHLIIKIITISGGSSYSYAFISVDANNNTDYKVGNTFSSQPVVFMVYLNGSWIQFLSDYNDSTGYSISVTNSTSLSGTFSNATFNGVNFSLQRMAVQPYVFDGKLFAQFVYSPNSSPKYTLVKFSVSTSSIDMIWKKSLDRYYYYGEKVDDAIYLCAGPSVAWFIDGDSQDDIIIKLRDYAKYQVSNGTYTFVGAKNNKLVMFMGSAGVCYNYLAKNTNIISLDENYVYIRGKVSC